MNQTLVTLKLLSGLYLFVVLFHNKHYVFSYLFLVSFLYFFDRIFILDNVLKNLLQNIYLFRGWS